MNQPHALHSSLTFATRCNIGAAILTVTPLKLGRQYSFVRVQLHQHAKLCIDATVTHANILQESGATLPSRGVTERIPDRLECVEAKHMRDPTAEFRRVTRKLKYMFPKDSLYGSGRLGPSVREQWVALSDGSGRGFRANDLGYICDMVSLLKLLVGLSREADGR